MKGIFGRIVDRGVRGFMAASAVVILVFLSVLVVLWWQGMLTGERIAAALEGLRGIEKQEKADTEPTEQEEWHRLRKAKEEQVKNLDTREKELRKLLDIVQTKMEQLKRAEEQLKLQREELEKEKLAFEAMKKKHEQEQKDKKFKDNLDKYSEMSSRVTAELWFALTDEEVVRYLRAMKSDIASDKLKAMQRDQKWTEIPLDKEKKPLPSRLDRIVKLMQ